MHYQKFSRLTIIVFLTFSNYVLCHSILIPNLIENFGRNAWYFPLLMIPFVILLSLIIDTDKTKFLKRDFIKSKTKIILILYSIIVIVLISYSSIFVIKYFFYKLTPNIIFYICLIGLAAFISYFGIYCIINMSTIIFLIVPIILIIPLILGEKNMNVNLILPVTISSNSYLGLILLLIPLDMLSILLFNSNAKSKITKTDIILPSIFIFLIMSINMYLSTNIFSANFLRTINLNGYIIYDTIRISKNFDNFDLVLIYIITITSLFKIAYHMHILRLLLKLKRNKKNILNIFFMFLVLTLIYNHYNTFIEEYIIYAIYCLIGLKLLFLIYTRVKESGDQYEI